VVTDPAEVRRLSETKEAENLAFRRYLHDHHYSDEPFHVIAAEVEKEIDCKQCANCCRQTVVSVSAAEIQEIARYLRVDAADVARTSLEADARFPHEVFLRNGVEGCVFLDGNLCMIYEARPRVCREFPHLRGIKRSPATAMDAVCRRSAICPIVYNALEEYKHQLGFHG
jgi:uncharacterized protein